MDLYSGGRWIKVNPAPKPAEPAENVPRETQRRPRAPRRPTAPAIEVAPRAALRDNLAVDRMEIESAHTGTMVELLQLPRVTIETIKDLGAMVRQQVENNKLQAELSGAVVHIALAELSQRIIQSTGHRSLLTAGPQLAILRLPPVNPLCGSPQPTMWVTVGHFFLTVTLFGGRSVLICAASKQSRREAGRIGQS